VDGDGTVVRDYVHVDDVVKVVLGLAGRRDVPPVVNVGTGVGTSVADLLRQVAEITGTTVPVERRPARPGDVHRVVLDIGLLRSLLPFDPLPVREGLARTWTAMSEAALTPG
jgi:UDP-glucose 4-epimerase